jgi:galactose mutarotase-like enzyme
VNLQVFSTENGVQLYASDAVDFIKPSNGQAYSKHQALCLETHNFLDSVNHVSSNLISSKDFAYFEL